MIVCHLGLGGVHSAKNFFRMQSSLETALGLLYLYL